MPKKRIPQQIYIERVSNVTVTYPRDPRTMTDEEREDIRSFALSATANDPNEAEEALEVVYMLAEPSGFKLLPAEEGKAIILSRLWTWHSLVYADDSGPLGIALAVIVQARPVSKDESRTLPDEAARFARAGGLTKGR